MTETANTPAPERKALPSPEMSAAYEDMMRGWEAFKDSNERRLAEIEKRGSADVVSDDKVGRINAALDEQRRLIDGIILKQARPSLGHTGQARSAVSLQHKAAFEQYVRKGEAGNLAVLEAKALSIGSSADGGYLVPPETEAAVTLAMRDISPIRAIATVQQVSSNVYNKAFSTTGFAAGWTAETAVPAQTSTTSLAQMSFQTMELYAMPAASSQLLDDSIVNIDQWIADEVKVTFAQQEGTAFVAGNGQSQPKGILSYPTVAQASYAWGSLGYIATGVAGALPATNPSDKLFDLTYALKSQYRQNAHWIMDRSTQSTIRKLKDNYGDYLWSPAIGPGGPATLMGFPIAESEDMPAIGPSTFSLGFGDFARGYLIVDRIGIRILRDPFTVKPYVLFYTTKRVGGGIQDFDAIKLLKFDVS